MRGIVEREMRSIRRVDERREGEDLPDFGKCKKLPIFGKRFLKSAFFHVGPLLNAGTV